MTSFRTAAVKYDNQHSGFFIKLFIEERVLHKRVHKIDERKEERILVGCLVMNDKTFERNRYCYTPVQVRGC